MTDLELERLASELEAALDAVTSGSAKRIPPIGPALISASLFMSVVPRPVPDRLKRLEHVVVRASRLHTAVHEAAHAVVSDVLGVEVTSVSIDSRDTYISASRDVWSSLRVVAISLAAPAMELRLRMVWPPGMETDLARAQERLAECGLAEKHAEVGAIASQLVELGALLIEHVAIELFRGSGTLLGHEFRRIVAERSVPETAGCVDALRRLASESKPLAPTRAG